MTGPAAGNVPAGRSTQHEPGGTSIDRADLATKADLDRAIGALRPEMRRTFGFQAALVLAIAAKPFGIV